MRYVLCEIGVNEAFCSLEPVREFFTREAHKCTEGSAVSRVAGVSMIHDLVAGAPAGQLLPVTGKYRIGAVIAASTPTVPATRIERDKERRPLSDGFKGCIESRYARACLDPTAPV